MALVSPGLQVTVTDNSQYVSNAIGTVPLVVMATAQDKTLNGTVCSGTTKANAGALQIFGSQRDLSTAMGYPIFQQSSAGTPLHGNELNEYGLMTAYSALGLGNQLYAIRADIDLNQLAGTSVRPTAAVADGTYWLDLADSNWGIYEWSASTQSFTMKTPLVITNNQQTVSTTQDSLTGIYAPLQSIGAVGDYAVVTSISSTAGDYLNRIFYKAGKDSGDGNVNGLRNTWNLLGTKNFHKSHPTVVASTANPTVVAGNLYINNTWANIASSPTPTIANVVAAINNASITGVSADTINGALALYSDSTANGVQSGDGVIVVGASSTAGTLTSLGLSTGSYNFPDIRYSNYAAAPYWNSADATYAPNGAVWLKIGAVGNGLNLVVKKYNTLTNLWNTQATPVYANETVALYGLDPSGGGMNISVGALYVLTDPTAGTKLNYAGFKLKVRTVSGVVSATSALVGGNPFTSGTSFQLAVTTLSGGVNTATVTLAGTTTTDFVTAVLGANLPYLSATVNIDGTITMTHTSGGDIYMNQIAGQPTIPQSAGFTGSSQTNVFANGNNIQISGFKLLHYAFSTTQPVADPDDGTLWYYSDPTVVDVMINDGSKWRGYQTGLIDARGYSLTFGTLDPAGVIAAAVAPTTQTDNTTLARGDLWLDTSDLENWPKISRWNGVNWTAIDNTDQISQNGILFADARWDTSGTTDPISDNETAIAGLASGNSLITSNYVDLDVPNPALYPRGMLLLNTRRSGYNVKRYVEDYYVNTAFDVATWSSSVNYSVGTKVLYGSSIYVCIQTNISNSPVTSPTYWTLLTQSAWVTDSGLKDDGSPYAGHNAQRRVVVAAMNAAVEANTEIREDQFKFQLICAPGYPELIPNLVGLNNDRANTAFVIGDTPMTLSTNVVDLTNWSNDTNGTGLATADPYLAVYYPSGLSTDLSGNEIMVPPSHMALRTYMYNDNVSYPWFAPAGTRRGLVNNATDLGYLNTTTGEFTRTGVSQALRDALYQLKINPITILTGIGMVIWGQKTRDPNTESMDRVNVARLVNYLRTIFASAGNAFLFEPNDKITRDQFAAQLNSALNDLVAKRGLYDYLVVCDTSNNTPDVIANNQLYADIAIEPEKAVEFIYIPIRLYNPGQIAKLGSQ